MPVYLGPLINRFIRDLKFLVLLVTCNVLWFAGIYYLLRWLLFS